MNCLILSEFIKCIEFPAQLLLRKLFVDKRVASSANINTALFHVRFVKMLFKPLVAVTGSRNEMMESNELVASTQGAHLTHRSE
jgi:hypothetical protein